MPNENTIATVILKYLFDCLISEQHCRDDKITNKMKYKSCKVNTLFNKQQQDKVLEMSRQNVSTANIQLKPCKYCKYYNENKR